MWGSSRICFRREDGISVVISSLRVLSPQFGSLSLARRPTGCQGFISENQDLVVMVLVFLEVLPTSLHSRHNLIFSRKLTYEMGKIPGSEGDIKSMEHHLLTAFQARKFVP